MECRWGVSQSGEIGEMGSTRPRSRGERWVRDDVRGTLGRDVIVTDQYTPRTTHDRFIHSSSACVIIRAPVAGTRDSAPRGPRPRRTSTVDGVGDDCARARSRGTEARQAEAGAAEAANCGGPRGATSRIL